MQAFIELPVAEDEEVRMVLVNRAHIGRVYPNPQSTKKCIVELSYHSISDAPVFLEVEMAYETLKTRLLQE